MAEYHIDYETFSEADLSEVGAYKYAEHASTRILMASISRDDGPEYLWVHPECEIPELVSDPRAAALLAEAFDPSAPADTLVWAHNAQFERAVTRFRAAPDMGLTPPPAHRWRCTAAVARKAALPDSLEKCGAALNLSIQKDKRGSALIRKFSMPHPKSGIRVMPEDDPLEFAAFGEYCLTDTKVEKQIHAALKAFLLRGSTLDTFLLDITLNDRGIPVNVPALQNARRIIDECQTDLHARFQTLTGLKPTQRARIVDFLAVEGVEMKDMKQKTIEAALEKLPQGLGRDTLALYAELNFAAAKKVHSMLECVNADGRVRGTLLYYGAGTGRWAGRLIQPQNFKKPTIKHTELAYAWICDGCTRDELALVFGNPLEVIASCIRHFIHLLGRMLFDADYAAIEARVVCWLAGQEDALERFRKKIDSYKVMAGRIWGVNPDTIANPSKERDLGKTAVLGCGFAMGWKKFKDACHAKGLTFVTDEMAQKAVSAFRELHDKVARLWSLCDDAARKAIQNPGQEFRAGPFLRFRVVRQCGMAFLLMTLPSGRSIAYAQPKIETLEGDDREGITFFGQMPGSSLWGRVRTYGGKLVENATQAVAADIMAHGANNAEREGYEVLTLIHDQALAAVHEGQTVERFCELLTATPDWARGLPVKAEGKVVPYYTKG